MSATTSRLSQRLIRQHLRVLRRVPDDIILAVGARHIRPQNRQSCLCGWIIREYLGRVKNKAAERITSREVEAHWPDAGLYRDTGKACALAFGGDRDDWAEIYLGIMFSADLPEIEVALMRRLDEAIEREEQATQAEGDE